MSRSTGDVVFSIAFLVIAVGFLALSVDISDPKAELFPRILAISVLLFSGWTLATSLQRRQRVDETPSEEGVDLVHFLAVMGLALVYVPAMAVFGYVAATAVFIAVGIWLLGYRNIKVVLAMSVLLTLFVFVVFKTFMYASLPSSFLDKWLTELIYRYLIT